MKLYIYDHCPYCVKARMIFPIKNIKFDLEILLNDDEKTPISMIGQKMLPILEIYDDINNKKIFIKESLDIIDYIDKNYGNNYFNIINKSNQEIDNWLNNRGNFYYLTMKRWLNKKLPEFATENSKKYFLNKKYNYIYHNYDEKLLISDLNNNLIKLQLILEDNYNKERIKNLSKLNPKELTLAELTLSDINLFTDLRSISIIEELKFPKIILDYMNILSDLTNIDLYFN